MFGIMRKIHYNYIKIIQNMSICIVLYDTIIKIRSCRETEDNHHVVQNIRNFISNELHRMSDLVS